MMLATKIINIYRVFLYIAFERMKFYGQNGCVSIVDNVVGLMLRTGFEDGSVLQTHSTSKIRRR